MRGYVYLLSNPAMPGLLKVGHTAASTEKRLRSLHSTAVPAAFVLEATFLVADAPSVERQIHEHLATKRYATNREFFRVTVREAYEVALPLVLACLQAGDGNTPELASTPTHDLDEHSVLLLQLLATSRGNGLNDYQIGKETGQSELMSEVRLAKLLERRLVSHKRLAESYCGALWRITPRGSKFLADHGLIADWMLRE